MTSNQDQLVKNIQSAVAASPELQKQLAIVQSNDQAADLLSKALGSPVTAADLKSLSDKVQSQMTDEQLEAVAAGAKGKLFGLVLFTSLSTWGVGCAMASAIAEIGKLEGGCKRYFEG